jgi:hypothetical protein
MEVPVETEIEVLATPRRQEARHARRLARELDCMLEDDIATLARAEIATLRNWRSRRVGPPFVVLGNVVLYPIASSREWIARNVEATLPAATPGQQQRRRQRGAA